MILLKDTAQNPGRERENHGRSRGTRGQAQGFRLSSAHNAQIQESEDALREKEHKAVKVCLFIYLYTHILYFMEIDCTARPANFYQLCSIKGNGYYKVKDEM